MINMETIRHNLKEVKCYYSMQHLFVSKGRTQLLPPDYLVKRVTEYEKIMQAAPLRLRLAYDNLYRLHKTQKEYALDCGVSEKYIQILNKRIIVFIFNFYNKEQQNDV